MDNSSEKFLNIITNVPDALLIISPELYIVHASKEYLRLTMADKRSIIGKYVFEAFPDNPNDAHADGVQKLRASLQQVLKTRKPHEMPVQKYDVPKPDGTFQEKYWSVLNTPVIGESGEIEHIIHSVSDITEKLKTEAALELALGAAQLGTWEIDLATNAFIHRNTRHDEIYGYNKPQPTWNHKMAREKILKEDLPVYDTAFSNIEKTGAIDFEVRTQWEDKSIHWMEIKGKVYLNTNGRAAKAAGVNIDITEQRLTEEAYLRAKEEAESAAMAKDEFLSTMSHEIRTPLNAVIGISNLLLEDNLTESQKSNLDSLHFAADNLLHLINNVLDFSKIQAGKIEVTRENFDLSDLVYNLIKTHEPKAIEKNIELVLNLGQEVPKRIWSDPFLLSQILHNLIGNALKFTARGRISVSVENYKQEKGKRWLRFVVEDTGQGIAPDKLEFIFQKFAQQRNFSQDNHEGTGLGLPITKSLVEILEGEIVVDSTPGKGSKFYFVVPVTEASLSTTEESEANKLPEKPENFEKKQILCVEDVEINRRIIVQYLKKWWNMVPDEAENGEQALEMTHRKKYDLILMDLRMPGMDGYKASKEIRKIHGYNDVPILAFTAEIKSDPKHSGLFNDTIFKPFKPENLKYKIQKHLLAPHVEIEVKDQSDNEFDNGSDPDSFNIERFSKMAEGDPEMIKKFVSSSVKAFEEYRSDFLNSNEEAELADLVHKNTMNVHYIGAVVLQEKIEAYRKRLTENRSEAELKADKKEVLAEFDLILEGLNDVVDSLPGSSEVA